MRTVYIVAPDELMTEDLEYWADGTLGRCQDVNEDVDMLFMAVGRSSHRCDAI